MTDAVVVDASVAMKWFVDEDGTDRAEALLSADIAIAPAIILSEVGNGLWSKRKASGIDRELAVEFIAELPQLLKEVVAIDGLISEAMRLTYDLDHPLYDCIYLALALARDIPLVTADERFIKKLTQRPIALSVYSLTEFTP